MKIYKLNLFSVLSKIGHLHILYYSVLSVLKVPFILFKYWVIYLEDKVREKERD